MLTLGRLLRLSLTATAIADIAAGIVLGAGFWPGGAGPWLLIAASLCVYHGGMALNDWADRAHDARTRPERPLPSGAISPRSALGLAATLLIAGPLLAALVDPRPAVLLTVVALLAALYDVRGRGPWLGPLLLGVCRALNLACGVTYGIEVGMHPTDGATHAAILALPSIYGLYVFVVSRLGRLEDREDEVDSRRVTPAALVALAGVLLIGPALVGFFAGDMPWLAERMQTASYPAGLLVCLAGAFGLLKRAATQGAWSPATIGATMGMALRRLLIFTSATALLTGGRDGLLVGVAILLGYPLSHALRKVFPPS